MKTLTPGQNVNLTKENPTLKTLGLSITSKIVDKELEEEAEFGIIPCGENDKAISPNDLIYFNNNETINQDITFNEELYKVTIDFKKIPENVKSLDLVYWLNNKSKTFNQLQKLEVKIADGENENQLLTIDGLTNNEVKAMRAMVILKIYRYNNDWKIKSISEGWRDGVSELLKTYGVGE